EHSRKATACSAKTLRSPPSSVGLPELAQIRPLAKIRRSLLSRRNLTPAEASSGLSGSSMTMMSPPRPVSVPPTDVARRNPRGKLDLRLAVFERPDPGIWESGPVPGRFKHRAKVIGVLLGKVGGIADTNNAARWVAAKDKSRKSDRGGNRL